MYSLIAQANVNQAADCFPVLARGRQCVPCSLMYLFMIKGGKHPKDMACEDLFNILKTGSSLYCGIHNEPSYNLNNYNGLVDPGCVPQKITYNGTSFFLRHIGVKSGLMTECRDKSFDLFAQQLIGSCLLSNYLIIMFAWLSVGVYKEGSMFYVFDSHARNKFCNPHEQYIVIRVKD